MKYLKKFQTNADYQMYKGGGDYVTPNVSIITEDDTIVFEPFINTPSLITFTITTYPKNPIKPGTEYKYETIVCEAENGMNWIQWCNSKYNINGFTTYTSDSGKIYVISNYDITISDDGLSGINGGDLIENNATYYYG